MTSLKTAAALGGAALTLTAALAIGGVAAARQAAPAAQAPAAARPAAPVAPTPSGPPIAGLCVFSNERAVAESAVGKATIARIQQLAQTVNAELTSERTTLENDAKAFQAQRASLPVEQAQQRELTLQQRVNALGRKAEQRQREMNATEQKALGRIGTEMQPLLRTVYGQKNCSVLLDRNATFGVAESMDVTPQVIAALNGKIQRFDFDRERLDAPAAQPAAAAAKK